MSKVCYLEITSLAGMSLGATHYYGKLICGDERIELERVLTSKSAAELSIKDDPHDEYKHLFHWRAGQKTTRFDTKESIKRIAKRVMHERFPCATILLVGNSAHIEPMQVLVGPDELKSEAKRLLREYNKIGWVQKGYFFYSRNEKKMDKISDEWEKLIARYSNE